VAFPGFKVEPAREGKPLKPRVNDHPQSGWLGFYRHRREKTGAQSAPIVAGGTWCEAPGLENPIKNSLSDLLPRDVPRYSCIRVRDYHRSASGGSRIIRESLQHNGFGADRVKNRSIQLWVKEPKERGQDA
jgi:hypothetical protein